MAYSGGVPQGIYNLLVSGGVRSRVSGIWLQRYDTMSTDTYMYIYVHIGSI